MPVAQLVNHFESIEHTTVEPSQHRLKRASKRLSFSSRNFSLKTIFRGHTRASSSLSAGTTGSSMGSTTSPALSSSSFEFLPATSSYTSSQTDRMPVSFAASSPPSEFPEHIVEMSHRPVRIQRTFSSTSIALQSEYQVDRFESPSLELFEPRPRNIFGNNIRTMEPLVLDGILEVMESA